MRENIRKVLQEHPVFTVRDLASLLNKTRNYTYLQVYRWKKKKSVYEIEKGKYTLEEDPFLIASWIVWPSYVSGWAALHYHHLTEQLPFTIQIMTTRKRNKKTINYHGTKLELTTVKPSLFAGFQRTIYQQREIFIAEKEKAIIDALSTKKMSIEEGIEMIKNNKRKINRAKLFSYAKQIKGLYSKLKRTLYD